MGKTYVIGDIHGNIKALKQVLERSEFDYEEDTLIQLGDIVDGWGYTYDVVEELLSVVNLICIKGNHDDWFNTWLQTGVHPSGWMQGAHNTAISYLRQIDKEIYELIGISKGGYSLMLKRNMSKLKLNKVGGSHE